MIEGAMVTKHASLSTDFKPGQPYLLVPCVGEEGISSVSSVTGGMCVLVEIWGDT